jgi:hypothetical protein
LWIGKDPDFNSVQDAAFARLRNVSPQTLLYKITLGMTLMDFTVKFASFFFSLSAIFNLPCQVAKNFRKRL